MGVTAWGGSFWFVATLLVFASWLLGDALRGAIAVGKHKGRHERSTYLKMLFHFAVAVYCFYALMVALTYAFDEHHHLLMHLRNHAARESQGL
jgi:hypothetical protein